MSRWLPINRLRSAWLLFFLLILKPAPTALAKETHHEPFYLGVSVEADPEAWGDLPKGGRFSIEGICQDLAAINMNAVWVTGFDGERANTAQMGRWLESARAHTMKVVLQGSAGDYAIKKGVSVIEQQTHLRQFVVPIWKGIAKRFRSHFALLAYVPVESISDAAEEGAEPTLRALDELGSVLGGIDVLNPVITNHDAKNLAVAQAEARIRRRSIKILAAHCFPFMRPHPWSEASWATQEAATQGMLDITVKQVRIASSVGVPMWLTGQAFGSVLTKKWVGQWEDAELPSKEQMHLQVWTAIIAGAKGFFASRYQSSREPSDPEQARVDDWEVATGLRTLEGEPTTAYEGLKEVAAVLSRHLSLLGELKTDGELVVLKPRIIGRRFKSRNGKQYAVVLNQNLESSARLPQKTALGSFSAQEGLRIPPGHGVLFQANDGGEWVPVTPCEIL